MITAFERAARVFGAAGATLYYDVSPLLDDRWTGVQTVAAGIARVLLARLPQHVVCCLDTQRVETPAVAEALARRTGLFLRREVETGRALAGDLPLLARHGLSIGLSASVKRQRRMFDIEASLFHDLSALLLPQFHTPENLLLQTGTLLEDIASNDLLVAVSEATRNDLVAYLDVAEGRIVVAPNGVAWPEAFALAAANEAADAEPFYLVLGTREPRKNAGLIYALLEAQPALLDRHRFVFCGGDGWLGDLVALPASLRPAAEAGRIAFTGFVGELQKYTLLAAAEATIYPSFLEGFGLPILESLSAGTPAIASWSSGMPEAGGELCTYFDPFSVSGCHAALLEMRERLDRLGPAMAAACRAQASRFTWDASAAAILEGLERVILRRTRAAAKA